MSAWGSADWGSSAGAWSGGGWSSSGGGDAAAKSSGTEWNGSHSWWSSQPSRPKEEDAAAALRGKAEPWAREPEAPAAAPAPRAQSAPPAGRDAGRQGQGREDKWWLGVDAETRKKYAEEMKRWLLDINSKFSAYFSIIEENYDTVDQICRLYTVEGPDKKGKVLDPLFFDDNKVSDPEHRREFKKWFAAKHGVTFVDEAEPASDSAPVTAAVVEPAWKLQNGTGPGVPAEAVAAPGGAPPGQSWTSGWSSSGGSGWGAGWSGQGWTAAEPASGSAPAWSGAEGGGWAAWSGSSWGK